VSRRTETSYKAESSGKAAQHVKARGSGDTVNEAVVQRKFTFLSGEACLPCGIVVFLMRSPAGATGTTMSRRLWDGLSPEDEIRNKGKQTRKRRPPPCGATLRVRRQESAEAISGVRSRYGRRDGWKRALENQGWTHPAEGPNMKMDVVLVYSSRR